MKWPMDYSEVPQIPFFALIDADHNYLIKLATQIHDSSITTAQFVSTLTDIIWRLVRHDACEELVMRPAMARILGAEGVAMANSDREDHSSIKQQLLTLWDSLGLEASGNDVLVERSIVLAQLKPILHEMAEHMKEENTVQLARLRQMIGLEESKALGAAYLSALTMRPENKVLTGTRHSSSTQRPSVHEFSHYIRASMDEFRNALATRGEHIDTDKGISQIMQELADLGLGDEASPYTTKPTNLTTKL